MSQKCSANTFKNKNKQLILLVSICQRFVIDGLGWVGLDLFASLLYLPTKDWLKSQVIINLRFHAT